MKNNIIFGSLVGVLIILSISLLVKKENIEYSIIGAVLPLSGPASFVGEDYKRGMELAASDFGVEVNFQDGKAAPTDSLNSALQLSNMGIKVILTAFRGASLSVASSFKDKDDTIVFSTTATSDEAPIGDFGDNFFAIGAEMISSGARAGIHANNNCSSAVTLTEQTDAGADKVKGFSDSLDAEKVIFKEEFPTDKAEFRDLLTKVKQYNPDCIFVEVKSNYFPNFMNQLSNLGLKSKVYTSSYSINKDVLQNLSDDQKNLIIFSSTSINPKDTFSEKYFDTYERYPNDFALVGYEMVRLVAENQKGCEGDDYIQCLSDNLSNIEDIDSSVGKLNMDSNQEIKLRDNTLFEIVGNEFVEVI